VVADRTRLPWTRHDPKIVKRGYTPVNPAVVVVSCGRGVLFEFTTPAI